MTFKAGCRQPQRQNSLCFFKGLNLLSTYSVPSTVSDAQGPDNLHCTGKEVETPLMTCEGHTAIRRQSLDSHSRLADLSDNCSHRGHAGPSFEHGWQVLAPKAKGTLGRPRQCHRDSCEAPLETSVP